jgi:hypothetical protein
MTLRMLEGPEPAGKARSSDAHRHRDTEIKNFMRRPEAPRCQPSRLPLRTEPVKTGQDHATGGGGPYPIRAWDLVGTTRVLGG